MASVKSIRSVLSAARKLLRTATKMSVARSTGGMARTRTHRRRAVLGGSFSKRDFKTTTRAHIGIAKARCATSMLCLVSAQSSVLLSQLLINAINSVAMAKSWEPAAQCVEAPPHEIYNHHWWQNPSRQSRVFLEPETAKRWLHQAIFVSENASKKKKTNTVSGLNNLVSRTSCG